MSKRSTCIGCGCISRFDANSIERGERSKDGTPTAAIQAISRCESCSFIPAEIASTERIAMIARGAATVDAHARTCIGRDVQTDRRMNTRHAIALTLVGWYLMIPPHDSLHPQTNAPLNEWTTNYPKDAFQTQQECEHELALRRAEDAKQVERSSMSRRHTAVLLAARCISIDQLQSN